MWWEVYNHTSMFTGIVETTGSVIAKSATGLTVERPASFDDIKMGSSIAVSGVCLSVIKFDNTSMSFDVVPETWSKTNLGDLNAGDRVNLERSMSATSRFEGHVVQGHIEATARVISLDQPANEPWATLAIDVPTHLSPFIVSKGSIALNGVSLTVASKENNRITIALIPHTLAITNLGTLKADDTINVETDIMARYVLTMKQ